MSKKLSKKRIGILAAFASFVFLFQNCAQQVDPGESYRNRKVASDGSIIVDDVAAGTGTGTGTGSGDSNNNGDINQGSGTGGDIAPPDISGDVIVTEGAGTPAESDTEADVGTVTGTPVAAVQAYCYVMSRYYDGKAWTNQMRLVSKSYPSKEMALEKCAFYYNQFPARNYPDSSKSDFYQRQAMKLSVQGQSDLIIQNDFIPHKPQECKLVIKELLTGISTTVKRAFRMEATCNEWAKTEIKPNRTVEGYFGGSRLTVGNTIKIARGGAADKGCVVKYINSSNVLKSEKYTGDSAFTKDKCMGYYTALHSTTQDNALIEFSFAGTKIDVTGMKGARDCRFTLDTQPAAYQNSLASVQVNRFYFADSCTSWKSDSISFLGTGASSKAAPIFDPILVMGADGLQHEAVVGELSNLGFMGFGLLAR